MGMFDEMKTKAEQAIEQHPEQVEKFSDTSISKGGDSADSLTGNRFGEQIDKGQQMADDRIGNAGNAGNDQNAETQP